MKKIVSYLAIVVISLFAFVGITKAEKIGDVELKGTQVIYIGRDGCGYCQAFVPGLEYLSEKYNFKYEYVNTDKLTEENFYKWLEKVNVEEEKFGTPTFAVLKDGKLVESHVGYVEEKELFAFLQKNGVIGSGKTYESKFKNLKFITNDEYLKIVEEGKKSIVVFSQATNSAGLNSRDMFDKLAKESGIDIYFYNLGFATQEEFDKFLDSNKFISDNINSLSLPMVMIIEGNETKNLTTFIEEEFIKKFIAGEYDNVTYTTKTESSACSTVVIIILSILLAASLAFNATYLLKLKKGNN